MAPSLWLNFLLFLNPNIGLNIDFKTQHCSAFHSGSTVYCNRAVAQELPTDQEIENIKDFFGQDLFTWYVDENDSAMKAKIQEHGLQYKTNYPALSLDLNTLAAYDIPEDIVIQEISYDDYSAREQLLNCFVGSFVYKYTKEFSFEQAAKALDTIHDRAGDNLHLYLGFYQGNIASLRLTIIHDDIVSLHWLGTLPEYRRKGLGQAITYTALIDAKKAGCSNAIVTSSPLGLFVTKKLGFKEYASYAVYGN